MLAAGGKLWWADEESGRLGTVTKRDGRNLVVLRNKTGGVVHMKVYDRDSQKGKQPLSPDSQRWTCLLMVRHCRPFAGFVLIIRKKSVPSKQRRMLAAVLPDFREHPQLLLHRWLQLA